MDSQSIITQDLRTLPCLSSLKETELSLLSEHARTATFMKDETLFIESDPMDYIYVVKTGRIKLFKTSMKGKELLMKILGPHEYFCCAPMFGDRKYPVSAKAVDESELVTIPVKDFMCLLDSGMSEMGMRVISGLCSRIKHLSNIVENLSFKDVEQRVIMTLRRLAVEKSSGQNIVSLEVSHNDIASMTGSVREVVSRTMSRLKKEGIIVASNFKGFTIDKDKLSYLISKSA